MRFVAAISAIALLLAVLIAGCGGDSSDSTEDASPAAATTAPANEKGPVEVQIAHEDIGNNRVPPKVSVPSEPPPDELVVKELSHVGGVEPKSGELVGVQYVGLDWESGKKFDQSWGPAHLYHYRWGSKKIPRSWQLGFQEVEVGDRRELQVPASLSGGKGAQLYIVEIVEVQPK